MKTNQSPAKKYRHKSTRRFVSASPRMRRPRRPGAFRPLIILCVVAVLTVTVALIWGSALKRRSDAYRESVEPDAWTLGEEVPALPSLTVSDFRGVSLSPGQSVDGVTAAGKYSGVVLTLSPDASGCLPYRLPLAEGSALTTAEGAPALESEVSRLHRAGLTVAGVFTVRCLGSDYTADPALAAYQRGLELGLLVNIANAGVDDILLVGLPYGNDNADARTLNFLTDLKQSLGYADHQPAIGVAMGPDGFAARPEEVTENSDASPESESNGQLYAGRLTPGRMLTVCDYLALDLRGYEAVSAEAVLKNIRYAYARYALRLLCDDPTVTEEAEQHGFTRIMEWSGNNPQVG